MSRSDDNNISTSTSQTCFFTRSNLKRMVADDVGQDRLDLFDSLDTDVKEERRLQVFALFDFYSETIVKVATTYLGLRGDIKEGNLNEKWKRAKNRLNQLNSFSSTGEYENAIRDLKEIRDTTFHDFEHWPETSRLKEIRASSEGFRDWLLEEAEQYDKRINELDARQTMIRISERNIQNTLNTRIPTEEPFQSTVRSKKQSARQIRDKLDSIKGDDEITMELVNLLMDSMEYSEDVSEAVAGFKEVDYMLAEAGEPEASADEFDF